MNNKTEVACTIVDTYNCLSKSGVYYLSTDDLNNELKGVCTSGKPFEVVVAFVQSWMRRELRNRDAVACLFFEGDVFKVMMYHVYKEDEEIRDLPVVIFPAELAKHGKALNEAGVIRGWGAKYDVIGYDGSWFLLHIPPNSNVDPVLFGTAYLI